MTYTGKDLIAWGLRPGPWFKRAIEKANILNDAGYSEQEIIKLLKHDEPEIIEARSEPVAYRSFLRAETGQEKINETAVLRDMDIVMSMPTVVEGAIMPDACPAGAIPVGGVVATKDAIHPGYHSADVCCSMAITILQTEHDPKDVLDAIQRLTHFGPTRRASRPVEMPGGLLLEGFESNPFLKDLENVAVEHFSTQGDGNHFYFVGRMESSGRLAIVSHHGSRGFGAAVYNRGLAAAHAQTRRIAPSIPKKHAWLDMNTVEGVLYWNALGLARYWTKFNHMLLHNKIIGDLGGMVEDQFWNPHNFVFERNGLFYHAKGATPSFALHSYDDTGRAIIPMNMSEPILIVEHGDNRDAVGFAPHGAGRNMSRSQFLRENEPEMPEGIDARFWCGIPDKSELPAAYKPAKGVISVIEDEGLAHIVDRVLPYGSIMAGDWERDAPWRKKREQKAEDVPA